MAISERKKISMSIKNSFTNGNCTRGFIMKSVEWNTILDSLKLSEFEKARDCLKSVLIKTELIHSRIFSNESGNDVYIKPENL
jgi:hypothetical protein